jgi:hypothetical protein
LGPGGRGDHRALQVAESSNPDTTKVRRQGKKTLEALLDGDRVLVHARGCKADLAESAKPPLTAPKVIAQPAEATEEEDD